MTISEFIIALNEVLDESGDIEVLICTESNGSYDEHEPEFRYGRRSILRIR